MKKNFNIVLLLVCQLFRYKKTIYLQKSYIFFVISHKKDYLLINIFLTNNNKIKKEILYFITKSYKKLVGYKIKNKIINFENKNY